MKKKIGIIIGCATLLIAAIILVILLFGGVEESYRSIQVQELNGATEVSRAGENLNAYKGMKLQRGDLVEVQKESDLILKLDMTKYVYAQEKTKFRLKAVGTENAGKLKIQLQDGQVLVDIQEKLSDDESFEVETENALLAVRGTVFSVRCYTNAEGEAVTEVSGFDGEVAVESSTGETISVLPGRTVLVSGTTEPVITEQETKAEELSEELLELLENMPDITLPEAEEEAKLNPTEVPTPAPESTVANTTTPAPEPTATSTPVSTLTPSSNMEFYEGVTKNGLKYTVAAGYVTINGLSDEVDRDSITEIEIPVEIDGYLVNVINKEAFAYCTALEKIVLPDSISTIHDEAFKHCYKLVDITLPKYLYYLGTKAFWECHSLAEIKIPFGVTKINSWTFSSCRNLTTVELPDGMKDIGVEAFSDCISLNRIKLPDTITSVGTNAFAGCSSLKEINLPSGLQLICNGTFSECAALTEIQIPEGVTSIGEKAFFECENLKKVSFPDTLTRIEIRAFASCTSLTQLEFNEGLKMIREYAFSNCKELAHVQLPASLTRMESGVFAECVSLTTISTPAGSYIESWAVENGYSVVNP